MQWLLHNPVDNSETLRDNSAQKGPDLLKEQEVRPGLTL